MFNIICGCTRGSPFIYKRIEEFALERIKGIALGHSDIFNIHFGKNEKVPETLIETGVYLINAKTFYA